MDAGPPSDRHKKETTMTTKAKPEPEKKEHEEKVLGSKEMAARLKIEPRALRVILRAEGKGTGGERYEFHEKDVPRLAALVKEHEAKRQEAAAEKAKED